MRESVEVRGRLEGRLTQTQEVFKERRGYWKLKEEALDSTVWRTRFGRAYGPPEGRIEDDDYLTENFPQR
jgi:hypothetical protein